MKIAHKYHGRLKLGAKEKVMNMTTTRGNMSQTKLLRTILQQNGLTLVEVMTVLVVIAMLALFAGPEIVGWKPRMLLKSAADDLAANLQRAKTHAIKNNVSVLFTFNTPGSCVAPACPYGKYLLQDNAPTPVTVAEVYFDNEYEGVKLKATKFEAGQGYDSRGMRLVIPGVGNEDEYAELESSRLTDSGDPLYEVWMTTGGGIKIEKKVRP